MATYETRAQWGATGGPGGYRIGQVSEVVVHHFWRPHTDAHVTAAYERSVVQGVQDFHESKGWGDIGYQWVVFQSGRAYEGRGWFRTGAHCRGKNSTTVGLCFAIDGDAHVPTIGAWATARQILAEGVQVGALTRDYRVTGHTDYAAKSCPGTRTYPMLGRLAGAEDEDDDMLREGDTGPHVAALQFRLANWYLIPCEVDGVFGPGTVKALKRWETSVGLPADGVFSHMDPVLFGSEHDARRQRALDERIDRLEARRSG